MNSDLILGNTCSLKAAQCGQVIDAYSVMVTLASAGPSAISGSDIGLATSAADCAIAAEMKRKGESPASAASPVNDKAAVKARRVMIKANSRIGASRTIKTGLFASLKRLAWQWPAGTASAGGSVNFA